MELNAEIKKLAIENNGVLTTADIEKLGFSRTLISLYEKNGLLERQAHGIYVLPNSMVDDMFLLSLRSNKIIFSHETALFLNGLSDRTPFKHSLTIPSNAKLSKQFQNECICFYIKPALFEMGKIEIKNTFGNIVNSYNAERTICDLVRSRSKIDEELFVSALKNYSASRNKNLHLLTEYSNKLGVKNILHRYLEVLL